MIKDLAMAGLSFYYLSSEDATNMITYMIQSIVGIAINVYFWFVAKRFVKRYDSRVRK